MTAPAASRFRALSALLAGIASAALVAVMATAGVASAATVTKQTAQECATFSLRTNWTNPSQLSLPQFNPALGHLTGVQLTRNVAVTSDLKFESTDSTAVANSEFELNHATVYMDAPGAARLSTALPPSLTTRSFPAFDGSVDYAGASGWIASFGNLSNQAVDQSTDLAAWTGTGRVALPAAASARTFIRHSGNYVADWSTTATVSACVVYTYTEEVLVCIGDYVWNDANKNGVQDAGEAAIAGRPVTVTVDGVSYATTTDANGRWTVCNLEPQRPCVITVDLPDGWTLTTSNQGTDDSTDSDAKTAGSDATIACVTPPRDKDLTFDVGIYQTPVAIDQPVGAAAPTAPAPAVLRIGKRSTAAVIRSGGTATFYVTVRNRGTVAVADVTVCDTPPRLLAFSSKPRGSFFRAGKLCWTIPTLGAGQSRTFSYTMRASSVATRSCVTNSVTATAAVGGSATTRAGLCIRPTRLRALPLAG